MKRKPLEAVHLEEMFQLHSLMIRMIHKIERAWEASDHQRNLRILNEVKRELRKVSKIETDWRE